MLSDDTLSFGVGGRKWFAKGMHSKTVSSDGHNVASGTEGGREARHGWLFNGLEINCN